MFVEFAIPLFLQSTLHKEQELHERSRSKLTRWETHDTSNIGLHQVSLPVTFAEFFPQCLNFLLLFFNRGDVGNDKVCDNFLKK
jgi:hypothetical protein